MTEHVVSFAVGIDDEAIIRNVEENAHKQIIQDIKLEVLNKIMSARYYNQSPVTKDRYSGNITVDRNAVLSDFSEHLVKEAFMECKDDIIERAATILADSYKRSKAWKEKVGEVVE